MLEGYGLHTFSWELSDERPSELLVASPADARGRGILLKVSQSGAAQSLVGARAYLLWRHRVTGRRGCEPMEALDDDAGRWRVYYPAAMQESEGAVDAQLMLSWDDRSLSTRVFQIRVEPSIVGGTQSRDGFTLFVDAIKRYEDGAALVGEATREASEAAAAAVRAREDLEAAAARGDFDGAEGRPGRDGADGRDGVSPTARVEQTESGATITVTDASAYAPRAFSGPERGLLAESVPTGIADAIRAQSGEERAYAPGEMAAAIDALSWEGDPVPRAVLSTDGTLELNCLGSPRLRSGGVVADSWEVAADGYAKAEDRPFASAGPQVRRVVIDPSWADSGIENGDYLLARFPNLLEVVGFENFDGMKRLIYTFSGDSSLETVYATHFDRTGKTISATAYGCYRLVGGTDGTMNSQMNSGKTLMLGAGGLLTDPGDNRRAWFWAHLYADGEAVLTAAGEPDASRELVSSLRVCAGAAYDSTRYTPWGADAGASSGLVRRATFAADMASYPTVNLKFLFDGCKNLERVDGLANLSGTRAMAYAFRDCAMTSIDLRGFDPSCLVDLDCTFSGCGSLATIHVDPTWGLPSSGVKGYGTFGGCYALVGGNGTAWSSSNVGYEYMRVDKPGQPGYLTAG